MALGKNFRLVWNQAIVEETVKRVAIDIINKGLFMIETDAKILCPVGVSGLLRAKITKEIDKEKLEGRAGENVEYAPYVEFGTGIHAEGGKGRKTPWVYKTKRGWFFTHGNVPQPYMRPAYEKNYKQIIAMFDAVFK